MADSTEPQEVLILSHLEASFDVMSLAEVLQWIGNANKSGRCRFRNGPATRTLYCRDGQIVACTANEPHLLLGQFLLYQGRIDEGTLRRSMTLQEATGRSLGEILVTGGVIGSEELDRRVTAKAEETVLGLFDWDAADLRFDPDVDPPGNAMRVDIDVNALLFEGMRRVDEHEHLREVFPSDGVVLHRTDRPPAPETIASHFGRILYQSVDGHRTLGELILLSRAPRFHAASFLGRLVEIGVLRTGEVREVGRTSYLATSPENDLRALVERGAYREATDLVERCDLSADAHDPTSMLVARAEAGFLSDAYRTTTPPDGVPRLVGDRGVPGAGSPVGDDESFLLQLIDGVWDVRSLVWITPLRKVETVRALTRLIEAGLVEIRPPAGAEAAPETTHADIADSPKPTVP